MALLYYSDTTNKRIGRVNLATGVDTPALLSLASGPHGIGVDGTYVYWANETSKAIGRAKLDGTEKNETWISGLAKAPTGLAVGPGYVYWSNTFGFIGRAKSDGTEVLNEWLHPTESLSVIVVDSAYVYWSDTANKRIGRAKLNGTELTKGWITGLTITPFGMGVDGSHVYWGNDPGGKVGRAQLDGTAVQQEWLTGVNAGGGSGVSGIDGDGAFLFLGLDGNAGDIARVAVGGTGLLPTWLEKNASIAGVVVKGTSVAPASETGPSVSGVPAVGEFISAVPGSVTGEELTRKWQWQRYNEETEEWENIKGATGEEYELTEEDEGYELRVIETVTNEAGSVEIVSEAFGPVEGFRLGTLGQPHGFPDWQPWLARQPTPLYANPALLLTKETVLGPLYVGGSAAINVLLQQTAGEKFFAVTVVWHVGPSRTQPYMTQRFYLHSTEGLLHLQIPSEADHATFIFEPLAAGGEATYRVLVQATESTVSERRLGADVLLSLAALEVAKEASTQKTLARTAPGRAILTVSATGEGAGRTLTFEQLNSAGEWVRYVGFALPNLSVLTAVAIDLPASPLRVTIGNTTAAAVKVDLAIGVS